MALERVPADIRKDGGVARMSDPKVIVNRILFSYYFNVLERILNKFDGFVMIGLVS